MVNYCPVRFFVPRKQLYQLTVYVKLYMNTFLM
jgi:hypothetical protein